MKNNKVFIIIFLILNIVFNNFYYNKSNRWTVTSNQEQYIIDDISMFIDNNDMLENTFYLVMDGDWNAYKAMNYLPDYYGYNLCLSEYIDTLIDLDYGYALLSNNSEKISLFSDKKILFKNEYISIFEL
jgi:hypothetical protein